MHSPQRGWRTQKFVQKGVGLHFFFQVGAQHPLGLISHPQ